MRRFLKNCLVTTVSLMGLGISGLCIGIAVRRHISDEKSVSEPTSLDLVSDVFYYTGLVFATNALHKGAKVLFGNQNEILPYLWKLKRNGLAAVFFLESFGVLSLTSNLRKANTLNEKMYMGLVIDIMLFMPMLGILVNNFIIKQNKEIGEAWCGIFCSKRPISAGQYEEKLLGNNSGSIGLELTIYPDDEEQPPQTPTP